MLLFLLLFWLDFEREKSRKNPYVLLIPKVLKEQI